MKILPTVRIKKLIINFMLILFTGINLGALCAKIPAYALEESPPLSLIYHPVSTTNRAAQQSFDRGLMNVFAYNHDLAFREFENAAKLDPTLAMAYWGMAVALGQNINTDVTPENEIKAYKLTQKALQLSSSASKNEQAYINALVTRYTNDPNADFVPLRFKYREAMKKVTEEYFEDLDAATLYAESILNLDPWRYWTLEGKPTDGVIEATEVLGSVLDRNPDHSGANHFNIHAWEESPTPERALMSANRLTNDPTFSGHLLHMPCHIFLLVGDYDKAIKTSQRAIAADKKYIQKYGMCGNYPMHYLSHNFSVFVRSYMLAEDYDNAIKTAFELKRFVEPHIKSMPGTNQFLIVPLEVMLYFHKWNEILAYKLPEHTSLFVQAYMHFSRAIAYANLGHLNSAHHEMEQMQKFKQKLISSESIEENSVAKVIQIGELVFNATLAGVQNQQSEQIGYLTKAIDAQDQLDYGEPPAWYMPIRIELGKVLLKQKRYAEAADIFQTALKKLRRNGRLLFGLTESLKGQGLVWNAFWTHREMVAALKYGQHHLTLDDL